MFLKQTILSDVTENKEGLKIVYDDVAPYAKEHSRPQVIDIGLRPRAGLQPGKGLRPRSTTVRQEFPDLKRDDLVYPGYSICAPGFALLNGEYINFPDNAADYGYISDELSGEDRLFSHTYTTPGLKPSNGLLPKLFLFPSTATTKRINNPELTVLFNQKFTSVGILITFNLMSGDYCTQIRVQWFSGNQLLSVMDFQPDEERYFCNNYVQAYDKVVITFLETSKPFRPVFVTRIDYGIYREFFGDEILDVSCLQEINAISENVSTNTMNFTARTKSNIPFDFQKKQKLNLYFNGSRIGSFYLKNGARKNKTDYHMDTHDAIGVLDGSEYSGGVYTGQRLGDVLEDVFRDEDFTYLLDDSLADIPLYGHIPYTTKHNALVQLAFAVGAVVDTSNYDGVLIYPQQTAASGQFGPDSIFDGLTLEHNDVVTGVRLTAHSWQPVEDREELYNDTLAGKAEIIFSEPYHSLSITGGEIIESNANYAIVAGTGAAVVLTGQKYNHMTSSLLKENPNIAFNKNIKEISDATLVHADNAQEVLERVYAYYQRAENVVGDVLLTDKVLGQVVEVETGYDGQRTGTLESINYQFSLSEIRAEVTIHE